MLSVVIITLHAQLSPPYKPPPVYKIIAKNLYDAGLQHGTLARERIQGWF